VTGIAELFRELSESDFYDVSAQLELFVWSERVSTRDRKRISRGPVKQVHHCAVCGEEGHRGWWRGEVICQNKRAA